MKLNKIGVFFFLSIMLYNKAIIASKTVVKKDTIQLNDFEIELKNMLEKYAVTNEQFYQNTLYTWTTDNHLEKIKKDEKAFLKGNKDDKITSYEEALKFKEFKKHPLAEILREKQFENKRLGWNSAWATCNAKGIQGNVLLKIKLKKEALICIVHPFYPTRVKVVDQEGKYYREHQLPSVKNRIAAVYYINDQYKKNRHLAVGRTSVKKGYTKVAQQKTPEYAAYLEKDFFRAYVLVNENMIESIEYDTKETIDSLQEEIKNLKLLLSALPLKGTNEGTSVLLDIYKATLSFSTNRTYQLTTYNIQDLIDILTNRINTILESGNK